jgi:hypothetical protein
MAKRFHNPRKSMGERDEYADVSARRAQEHSDGGMLHEEAGAMAFMPQNIIMKYYPKEGYAMTDSLNDGISGVDELTRRNEGKMKQDMKPKKT